MDYEQSLMADIKKFQNKVEADGHHLQDEVKTELSIIQDELHDEERKRRDYDNTLLFDVKAFLSELKD